MSKFNAETIDRWATMAADCLGQRGYDLYDVKFGSEAWSVAHTAGITKEAYEDRSVVDAHIVSALRKIFPNAVFKDKYIY